MSDDTTAGSEVQDEPSERDALWAEMDAADAAKAPAEETAELAATAAEEEAKPDTLAPPTEEKTPQDDPWAAAPEPLRAQWAEAQKRLEALEHDKKSATGRIAGYQRQLDELRAKVEKAPEPKATADFLQTDEYKALQEEYPELAPAVAKLAEIVQSNGKNLSEALSALTSKGQQDAALEQQRLLDEALPDWQGLIEDGAAFTDWLAHQPRHIREAAHRNATAIADAEEAADVLGRYKAFRTAAEPAPALNGNGAAPTTSAPRSGKRQQQLEAAVSVRSRGPAVAVGIPDDRDGAWDAFERMAR